MIRTGTVQVRLEIMPLATLFARHMQQLRRRKQTGHLLANVLERMRAATAGPTSVHVESVERSTAMERGTRRGLKPRPRDLVMCFKPERTDQSLRLRLSFRNPMRPCPFSSLLSLCYRHVFPSRSPTSLVYPVLPLPGFSAHRTTLCVWRRIEILFRIMHSTRNVERLCPLVRVVVCAQVYQDSCS